MHKEQSNKGRRLGRMRSSSVHTTGVTNCRQQTQDCDHDNDGDDLDAEGDDDYSDWGFMEEIKINNISGDLQYFWSPVSPRVMLLGLRKTPC